MPTFAFDRDVHVAGSPSVAWQRFTDVSRVVEWISVVGDARELEPLARYSAVLQDRIGMFALRADLDITISEVKPEQQLRARAEGQDRQVGSRIVIDATVELVPDNDGSRVRVSGSYDVTGRVATLGASSIRRKGETVLDDFFTHLEQELSSP